MSILKRIGLIGCGDIGSTLLHYLANDMASTYREQLTLKVVIVPERSLARVQQLLTQLGLAAKVSSDLTAYYDQLDWVIECAGHQALETHVVGALAHGCSAVVCSVGACANQSLLSRLEQAARLGGAHMQFVAGAVGAIDALAAARHSGLTKVVYQGIKPALAWQGTAAEQKLDLENLKQAHTFFQGDARQAALAFPQNANVAATIALAGV